MSGRRPLSGVYRAPAQFAISVGSRRPLRQRIARRLHSIATRLELGQDGEKPERWRSVLASAQGRIEKRRAALGIASLSPSRRHRCRR